MYYKDLLMSTPHFHSEGGLKGKGQDYKMGIAAILRKHLTIFLFFDSNSSRAVNDASPNAFDARANHCRGMKGNQNVLELMPYQAGKPVEELLREYRVDRVVKLGSNENSAPPPDNVAQAIKDEIHALPMYPDGNSYYLRERIAEYNEIGIEHTIVGSGSVELIREIVRVFLKPGETVLTAKSTFPVYKMAAIENGGGRAIVETEMDEGYGYDLEKMNQLIDAKTKIIFIANPNNPTGTILPGGRLLEFVENIPEGKIIVLDNAYQEYAPDPKEHLDGVELALRKKNVIVLRTFSKIYALAGLRIGYGIAHAETISLLNRTKAPFNVTRLSQKAAIASLENDDFKKRSYELNMKNKEILYNQLASMGMKPVPTSANFILFFPGADIVEVGEKLLREGVIVRPMRAFGVPDGIRVTVGFEDEINFFIEKLKRVLS